MLPCKATVYGRSCLAVAVTPAGYCTAHDPGLKAAREKQREFGRGTGVEAYRGRQLERAVAAKAPPAPQAQQESARRLLLYEEALKRIAGLRCRCFVLVPGDPPKEPGRAVGITKGNHEPWCPVGVARTALGADRSPGTERERR